MLIPKKLVFANWRWTIAIKDIPIFNGNLKVVWLVVFWPYSLDSRFLAVTLCSSNNSGMIFCDIFKNFGSTLVVHTTNSLILKVLGNDIARYVRIFKNFLAMTAARYRTEVNIQLTVNCKVHFANPWFVVLRRSK